eukprot:11734851-Karenia_brevis.AAC.1
MANDERARPAQFTGLAKPMTGLHFGFKLLFASNGPKSGIAYIIRFFVTAVQGKTPDGSFFRPLIKDMHVSRRLQQIRARRKRLNFCCELSSAMWILGLAPIIPGLPSVK